MFCSKCGTQLEEAARFCPACGAPLGDDGISSGLAQRSVKPRKRSMRYGLICGIAALVLIAAGVVVFFSMQSLPGDFDDSEPLAGRWTANAAVSDVDGETPVTGSATLEIENSQFKLDARITNAEREEEYGGIIYGTCQLVREQNGARVYDIRGSDGPSSWYFGGSTFGSDEVAGVIDSQMVRLHVPSSALGDNFGEGPWALQIGDRVLMFVAFGPDDRFEDRKNTAWFGPLDYPKDYFDWVGDNAGMDIRYLGSWSSSSESSWFRTADSFTVHLNDIDPSDPFSMALEILFEHR